MILLNDLYTAFGELLVKKNTEITPEVIRKVREKGEKHNSLRVPMKNSEAFKDFLGVFNDDRYIVMFKGPVTTKEIADVAGNLMIENDILFELSNMKRNLPYTYRHVLIVAAFMIKFALILKKNRYREDTVAHCGFTHDIGKTRIPIKILEKEGKLSREEVDVIMTHPAIGYLLLNYYLRSDRIECSLASLEHHEKLDGTGYPKGKSRVTKYSQLISAIDIMDALMTKRPYREKSYSLRSTLDYLLKEARDARVSMEVVRALISFARKSKPDIKTMKISYDVREKLPQDIAHEKFM